jgi:hypothetical protein
LEIMGEGESMGPWSDSLKAYNKANQGDIKYDIQWTTLREYLDFLERKGIATNVGSFVGATTIRENVMGFDDRPPTAAELIGASRGAWGGGFPHGPRQLALDQRRRQWGLGKVPAPTEDVRRSRRGARQPAARSGG